MLIAALLLLVGAVAARLAPSRDESAPPGRTARP